MAANIKHQMVFSLYVADIVHSEGISCRLLKQLPVTLLTRDIALASMARDDPPASSTASSTATCCLQHGYVLLAARRPQCTVKWDRNLKPKLAIMRQCTSVTDRRQTDGHWHRSI